MSDSENFTMSKIEFVTAWYVASMSAGIAPELAGFQLKLFSVATGVYLEAAVEALFQALQAGAIKAIEEN